MKKYEISATDLKSLNYIRGVIDGAWVYEQDERKRKSLRIISIRLNEILVSIHLNEILVTVTGDAGEGEKE